MIEFEFTFDYDTAIRSFNRAARVLGAMGLEEGEEKVGRKATEEDFESVTWLTFERGRKVTGVEHAQDIETMRLSSRQIADNCEPFDVVLTPVMPVPPLKLGVYNMNCPPEAMREFGRLIKSHIAFTLPFNISGQPAISLPLHWSEDGLPIGVQFAARYADEATLFRLAAQLEKARPWIDRKPPVCA